MKSMSKTEQMLERYLQAIETWLPKAQRRDILAEISEDLHSQIEERETALGRALNDGEVEALLKQRGQPMLVANRYQPQRSLIGPVWFPIYIFVLKVVGLCYVLPWLATYLIIARVQHPALPWGETLLATGETIWTVALHSAATVTIVFAILELVQTQKGFLENWNPRKLPPLRNPDRISRGNSIAEIGVSLFFVVWWMVYASSPVMLNGPIFKVTLRPEWMYFFWAWLAVGLSNIALSVANLRQPYWTRLRAGLRLLSDVAGGGLVCWLMRANLLATLSIAGIDPARTAAIRNATQFWMERCFPLSVIIACLPLSVDLWRLVRVGRRSSEPLSRGLAA